MEIVFTNSLLSFHCFVLMVFIKSHFLAAYDAKERQHWVNRLRATAEHHTDYLAQVTTHIFLNISLNLDILTLPNS